MSKWITSAVCVAVRSMAGMLIVLTVTACDGPLPDILDDSSEQVAGASTDIDALSGAFVPDELIVLAQPGAAKTDLESLLTRADATLRGEVASLSAYLVGFDAAKRTQVGNALAGSALVEGVLDNRLYDLQLAPNDPDFDDQWHLDTIGAPTAWDITTGNDDIAIGVVDTGVDPGHGDFADKLLEGANVYTGTRDTSDLVGHGTGVAGVIAAVADDGYGVAGIAWENPIVPVRVTSDRGRTTSWLLAAGIREAVSAGARVINVSFAPVESDELILRQARLAWLSGSLVVISSGNDGEEKDAEGSPWALFVGAVSRSGRLASFSTRGAFLDLVAPGVSIVTDQPGGTVDSVSGTSFAAPMVAGVASLVWAVNPNLGPQSVKDVLIDTATDLGDAGWDAQFGHGRVNAAAAVSRAREVVEAEDTTAPTATITSPAEGAAVSGDVGVFVDAEDDVDVSDVIIYVDGIVLDSDAFKPYRFLLSTSYFAIGEHEIKAVATDTSGNATEHAIALAFEGSADAVDPSVVITAPRDGSTVSEFVTILAEVEDDHGLASADILVDGQVIATLPITMETETSLAYNWSTLPDDVAAGRHELGVRVYDTSGNTASASVRVTVTK